ncbi:sulfatase family protein [Tichowtungia aerotolerans]|uniref:Sulfatase-like hydrolase/transferase n=1 Tax=Tichowtungia aerotolerans TaxID=2697043 RepID=A0A6P1MBL5_9BACT|nr:sulfatase [Tichowtungia aerotolerans]QHI68495.1 sulfatase-like hydrolase/transferase [Tichowtungia aerotolerans]
MHKPNILYILTDQMRSTAMGCAGVEKVKTPNIDRLAAQGTRFTNAVSNTPSCAPARGTILTGLHTLSHCVVNNELQVKNDGPTFAGALTGSGYKCGYIGKWHLDGGPRTGFTPPGPRRLGFDDYWAVANCTHDYMNSFYYTEEPKPEFIDGYEPIHQTDLAIRYIKEKAKADDPFFLVLSIGTPHDPYCEMPKEMLERYPVDDVELMETNSIYVPGEIMQAKKEILAGYYAHIMALDDQVGRLEQTLKEQGIYDDTIVVFTADHGDMLGNHEQYYKSQPWRESVGIPLLMRWPGQIPEGRVTDAPLSLIELTSSLISMTGTDIPEAMQGDDLSKLILGDESAAPDSVFINFAVDVHCIPSPPFRGVVTRTHTYAETPDGPWLLYDDKADPLQKNNLITWANRDNPEVVSLQQELHKKLHGWLERTSDPFDDGDTVSDKYQPGHVGGVLPIEDPPDYFPPLPPGSTATGRGK